jgi:phosphoesterase RecJ-like protein
MGKEAVIAFLKEFDDFLICTHINADADAIGSSVALSLALESMGKSTVLYFKGGVPELYGFLPGTERVRGDLASSDARGRNLLLLDCNAPHRAALEGLAFGRSAVIDHHETASDFGDIRWVDPSVPAAGLMVFQILKDMGVRITRDIAVNLYAAIAMDTGAFRFSNTNAEALRAAAELVDAGAEPGQISDSLYNKWNRNRFRLLCMNLGSIEIVGSVSFSTVSGDMFKETLTTAEDTENFVNFPLLMEDISVSACFRELERNKWKISLRSKGDIDVARVAERFQGGGHKNASGCIIDAELETAKKKLLEALKGGA